jgi:mRNA interferase RelE/StbE
LRKMSSFSIRLKRSIEKDLRRLAGPQIARVLEALEKLGADPFPRRSVKLATAERLYRIRVGDYRVVYEVDTEARQITVHYVRHRREAYRHA